MKKKIILGISCLFLLVSQRSNTSIFDNYLEKVMYFFLMDISITFVHECGHAFLMALNSTKPKIYMGVNSKNVASKSTDNTVNIVSYNPRIAVTKPSNSSKYKNKTVHTITATNGPFYGLMYSLFLYKMFDVFKDKLTPSMYISLRMYALVNAFGQIMYGYVPLCSFNSDSGKLYSGLGMSEKRYKTEAAKNLKALERYAQLSIVVSIIYKSIRKFHKILGHVESLATMKEFKEEHAAMFSFFKISSFYAIRATSLRILISTLKEITKENSIKHGRSKEEDYPAANPADWVAGTLVAPLII